MNFPSEPGNVTVEWLTSIMKQSGILKDQCVMSVEVSPLDADKGMTGNVVRLFLAYDSPTDGAPSTLVAKFSAQHPQVRRLLSSMGFYEREVRFYAEIAPVTPIRTPHCYFSATEPEEGYSLLLLEDLSDARNNSAVEGCSVEEAEMAVRAIAALHSQWWQHSSPADLTWLDLRGFQSIPQMQSSFDQMWEIFLRTISAPLAEQLLPFSGDLHIYLGRVASLLIAEGPRTIIHNDYHVENLFFVDAQIEPGVVVADWQVATRGRGVIDIARLLGGNLAPADRRAHELRLVKEYHALLMQNGVTSYSFERCWDEYRLAMLIPVGTIATIMGMAARMAPEPEALKGNPKEVIVHRYLAALSDLSVSDLLATL